MRVKSFSDALFYFENVIQRIENGEKVEKLEFPTIADFTNSDQDLLLDKIFEELSDCIEYSAEIQDDYFSDYIFRCKGLICDFKNGNLGEAVDVCVLQYSSKNEGRSVRFILRKNGKIEFIGLEDKFRRIVEKGVFEDGEPPEKIGDFLLEDKEFYAEFEERILKNNQFFVDNFSSAVEHLRSEIKKVSKDKNYSKIVTLPVSDNDFSDEQKEFILWIYGTLKYSSNFCGDDFCERFGDPELAEDRISKYFFAQERFGNGLRKFHNLGYISSDKKYGRTIQFFENNGEKVFTGIEDDFRNLVANFVVENREVPRDIDGMKLMSDEEFFAYIWKML